MLNSVNTQPFAKSFKLPTNTQSKAAKLKEQTGKKVEIDKHKTDEVVLTLPANKTDELNFAAEFVRVGYNSQDGLEATIENLSKRFVELKEEVADRYTNDRHELYKQLGKLHQAFENALQSIALSPQGVSQQLDNFYESFIENIQNSDFDTAFANSIGTVKHEEVISPTTPLATADVVSKTVTTQAQAHTVTAFAGNTPNVQAVNTSATQNLTYRERLLQAASKGAESGTDSRPLSVLNRQTFNMSMAFGDISAKSGTNRTALEMAFRQIMLELFDEAAHTKYAQSEDGANLEEIRQGARQIGNNFLSTFFSRFTGNSAQVLRDTGMSRAELAFHEAWNITYFEHGVEALGGTDLAEWRLENIGQSNSDNSVQSELEFRRNQMKFMMQIMRDNAEVLRQQAEMMAEEAERWRKIFLIAARISAGHNVPQQDRAFLMKHSPGMYMMASASRVERDDPRDYDSILGDDSDYGYDGEYSSSEGGSSSTSPAPSNSSASTSSSSNSGASTGSGSNSSST